MRRTVLSAVTTALILVAAVGAGAGAAPGGPASTDAALRAGLAADLARDAVGPGEALAVRAPGLDIAVAVGEGRRAGRDAARRRHAVSRRAA